MLAQPSLRIAALFLSGLLLFSLLLSGCGYDPREPAYDTRSNPKDFPQKAIELLDGIEAGRFQTYDAITNEFADLYMAHPGLLGNEDWNEVITRLGTRLVYRADRLVSDGLLQFVQAADFYAVAAQVHRTDTALARKSHLFAAWKAFVSDSTFDPHRLQGAFDADYRLALLRRFALADSTCHRFACNYLAAELFPESAGDLSTLMANHPVTDYALLASLGALDGDSLGSEASYVDGAIELVGYRLEPLDDTLYRFEAYFRLNRPVDYPLGVSLRIETPDPNLPEGKQPVFPYDFGPLCAARGGDGAIASAARTVAFAWPIAAIRIGVYELAATGPVILQPDGVSGQRVRFPVSPGN